MVYAGADVPTTKRLVEGWPRECESGSLLASVGLRVLEVFQQLFGFRVVARLEARAQLHGSQTVAGTPPEHEAQRRRAMIPIRTLLASLPPVSWSSERRLRHKPFASHRLQPLKKHVVLVALSTLAVLYFFPSVSADEHASTPVVLDLNLHGVVEPILATYIDEGIADAERRQAALILITMDTPGGLSDSMQDIIKHILASRVPVAVYITPTGARGASAGFFILLSADIAAMAPGTHTGAASPVIAIGGT